MTAFWLNVIWMMASQLWWEKSQGNLELYFAAPMSIMSVLFGMAVGGMVMSSTRAVVVLVVAAVIYQVQFAVDQWFLLIAVFLLTLAALYGLGMILASLFLMWGREAFHLTQLLTEPVYFVSGLNFPVASLGFLGALALAHHPAGRRARRDAPARLRRVGVPDRHATARGRGAHPRRHDRRLPAALAAGCSGRSNGWPARKAACRCAGNDRRHAADRRRRPALGSPEWGGFDPRAPATDRPGDRWRAFRTAAGLGWQMEANWTDPFLFFIYSVAKPVSAALILVVMLDIISGGTDPAYRAFVVVGTALWAIVLAGISGLAWTVLDDRERYRMLKYVYVSPSEFLVVLLGRGVARLARRAWSAGSSPSPSGSCCSASRSIRRSSTGRCSSSSMVLGLGRDHRHRHPAGRDLPPDAPGVVVLPGGAGRRPVPRQRCGLPAGRPAHADPGDRAGQRR